MNGWPVDEHGPRWELERLIAIAAIRRREEVLALIREFRRMAFAGDNSPGGPLEADEPTADGPGPVTDDWVGDDPEDGA